MQGEQMAAGEPPPLPQAPSQPLPLPLSPLATLPLAPPPWPTACLSQVEASPGPLSSYAWVRWGRRMPTIAARAFMELQGQQQGTEGEDTLAACTRAMVGAWVGVPVQT